jgi:hypothetical protein
MIQRTLDIQTIDDIAYQLDSDIPYTGKHTTYYDNGLKFFEINYVNGKLTAKEPYEDIKLELLSLNQNCEPPLTRAEVLEIVDNV